MQNDFILSGYSVKFEKKCYFLPFTYKPGDKCSVHIKSTTDRKHRTKIHNSWLKRGKCKKKNKK